MWNRKDVFCLEWLTLSHALGKTVPRVKLAEGFEDSISECDELSLKLLF